MTVRVSGEMGKGAKGAAMRRRWREEKMVEETGSGGREEPCISSASFRRASRAEGQERTAEARVQDGAVALRRAAESSAWQAARREGGRSTVLPCRGPPMT